MRDAHEHAAIVGAEGHLIDSNILNGIFDKVIERGGAFEVLNFSIGRTNEDFSRISLKVSAPTAPGLQRLVEDLMQLGCNPVQENDAIVRPSDRDGAVPDDFYSTTNMRTHVRVHGRWIEVERQRMDAVIAIDDGRAICRKLREVRTGDRIICGLDGIRVTPEFRERDRGDFAFMSNEISSERRVEASVGRIAALMQEVRARGQRIVFVAGPVVVHTGGAAYFVELIRRRWVDVVLAGNALAVHDAEHALFGTSLGVDLEAGLPVPGGTATTCGPSTPSIAPAASTPPSPPAC
jgi:lysine-ketoglutarate reductase/saccharopine dehydrogenase-like protein (TIGR00300 family)